MSPDQMRAEIIDAYSGDWPHRVNRMGNEQLAATYYRIRSAQPEKLKSNKPKHKKIRSNK